MIIKHLPDNFFDWLFFHAEVVHFAVRKDNPASLGHPASGHFQLN